MNDGKWSIDPYKLATQRLDLQGTVAVADMKRASVTLAADHGHLAYTVSFARDEDNRCVIDGQLQGTLTMRCHRCLQPFTYAVLCTFVVSPVISDHDAKLLPSTYEPVIVQDGKLDLLELLEDELILALPQVPMHEVQACTAAVEIEDKGQEMNNPFQILQKLTKKETPNGRG